MIIAVILGALALAFLGGCSQPQVTQALSSPPGQLFCAIQLDGGGSIVAGLLSAEVSTLAPAATPIAVIATNSGKAQVDGDCQKAAANVPGGDAGVPVSPPLNPATAPAVAIVAPASNTAPFAAVPPPAAAPLGK